ncbi:MAG: adenine deaminase [Phycisphaerales bacterium]|nr:adenine deaminase [Phycisphaerales bacterium]
MEVARGDCPADKVFRGGRVINVFTRSIDETDVAIVGDRIAGIGRYDGAEIIEMDGAFVAPGFIDAHMHVESTMLPPSGFAELALPHGTTAAIFDPHEIANVLGIPGIRLLLHDAEDVPLDCFFAASSCVPASPLETSGAVLGVEEIKELLNERGIIALAEMMNYPGVVHADAEVLEKVAAGLAHGVVDGHCPELTGSQLQAYAAAGISSDHESTHPEEAMEKLAAGLWLYIREGSAARNLEALLPVVSPENAHRICFCTDDRHPADLRDQGHIDHVVRKAIGLGLDPVLAICMASLHPAVHFRLPDHGAVGAGRLANLVVFDDLEKPTPRETWHHGTRVTDWTAPRPGTDWSTARGTVHLPANLNEQSFRMKGRPGTARVIGLVTGELVTEELRRDAPVDNGLVVADPDRDLLKIAVIERHGHGGDIGLGLVEGFGLRGGAIASTVGHDAHNLAVVGDNDADMLIAARALGEVGGGQCVVARGEVLAVLPLPIAGLMSDELPQEVIEQQRAVLAAAASLGCSHGDPFMPLSFLPLSVIPHLKVSDQGIVDVDRFQIVDLMVSD